MAAVAANTTNDTKGGGILIQIGCEVGMRLVKLLSRLAVSAVLSAGAVRAEDAPYPSRPVTVIVPFAAGGGVDIIGRMMAAVLSKKLSAAFVVENRPGAGGSVASNFV